MVREALPFLEVHLGRLLSPPSPAQGKGGGFHHSYGFPTVSEGAANPVRWSTDTASALVNAMLCYFTAT